MAQTTVVTVAPSCRSAATLLRSWYAEGTASSTSTTNRPVAVETLDETLRTVGSAAITHQDTGQPGHLGEHRSDRQTAEFQPAQDLGLRGKQGGHQLGEGAEQCRVGFQPVRVEMITSSARGSIADRSADPAAVLHGSRQNQDVGTWRVHRQIFPSVR